MLIDNATAREELFNGIHDLVIHWATFVASTDDDDVRVSTDEVGAVTDGYGNPVSR